MRNIKTSLIIAIFAMLPFCLKGAGSFLLRRLPTQGLLPVSNVHCVLQDSEGYMWYATYGGGLCRDNGFQIDVFRHSDTYPTMAADNNVICMAENEARGEIWFGMANGACILNKTDYSIRRLQGLPAKRVNYIVCRRDGSVWVACGHRLYYFSGNGILRNVYDSRWKGRDASIVMMCEDAAGTLWLTQWNGGIACLRRGAGGLTVCQWPFAAYPEFIVTDPRRRGLWIGTWGGGIVYRDKQGRYAPQTASWSESVLGRQVINMALSSDGNRLWAVTMSGIEAYDISGTTLRRHPVPETRFHGHALLDMLSFDRQGNLWVPGFSPQTFILSNPDSSIRRDTIPGFTKTTGFRTMIVGIERCGEAFWMTSQRTGLTLYNPLTGKILKTQRTGNVMTSDGHDRLFVADGGNISLLDGTGAALHSWRVPKGVVTALGTDGQKLWVGTDAGLMLADSNGLHPVSQSCGAIRDIEVADGKAYVLTAKAIYAANGYGLSTIARHGGLRLLAHDKHHVYAAGAYGKVYTLANDSLKVLANASDGQGFDIKALRCDGGGHLWILTDQTIREYDPVSGLARQLTIADDRIRMDNFGALCVTPKGVCVAGAGGLCMISYTASPGAHGVRPAVASFITNGSHHFVGYGIRSIEIKSGDKQLQLLLTVHDVVNATSTRFAYRLKGWHTDWVYLPEGQNTATIVNLPKGTYSLEVKATDGNGYWSDPASCLTIHRLPAWWETWWARTIYIIIFITVAVIALGSYLNHYQARRREEMERRLTEMKFSFFTNISHELRTPLTLILAPLESLRQHLHDPQPNLADADRKLNLMQRQANSLLQLVNRLLDFRKLEMGERRVQITDGDIFEMLRSSAEAFRPMAVQKRMTLAVAIPEGHFYTRFDHDALRHIMMNLLSNAFKYTPEGGTVTVRAWTASLPCDAKTESRKDDAETMNISVADTGIGISKSDMPHIFDEYYQAGNAKLQADTQDPAPAMAGTGIGLSMTKKLVELYHGTIAVTSREGHGSTFTVTLPLAHVVVADKDEKAEAQTVTTAEEKRRPCILVVDDNVDFREFLANELSGEFDIVQACDGEEGLRMAHDHDVDIVVSDVMMPRMDGNEMCRRLKSDVKTSHLFVILLTARGGTESELSGYESGADAYITKPFNLAILRNRITHFLRLRQRQLEMMRQLMLNDVDKSPDGKDKAEAKKPVSIDDMPVSALDKQFLKQLMAKAEEHFSDPEYGVEAFSSDMCMSHMNLYRKMQALVGKTPSDYLRDCRLDHAVDMLRNTTMSTAGVAEACGFSTPSYFTKVFKKRFGVLPKDFQAFL